MNITLYSSRDKWKYPDSSRQMSLSKISVKCCPFFSSSNLSMASRLKDMYDNQVSSYYIILPANFVSLIKYLVHSCCTTAWLLINIGWRANRLYAILDHVPLGIQSQHFLTYSLLFNYIHDPVYVSRYKSCDRTSHLDQSTYFLLSRY